MILVQLAQFSHQCYATSSESALLALWIDFYAAFIVPFVEFMCWLFHQGFHFYHGRPSPPARLPRHMARNGKKLSVKTKIGSKSETQLPELERKKQKNSQHDSYTLSASLLNDWKDQLASNAYVQCPGRNCKRVSRIFILSSTWLSDYFSFLPFLLHQFIILRSTVLTMFNLSNYSDFRYVGPNNGSLQGLRGIADEQPRLLRWLRSWLRQQRKTLGPFRRHLLLLQNRR